MSRKPELVDPGLLLVQLAAGMYVIIRGFDNFAQSAPFAASAAAFRALWDLMNRAMHLTQVAQAVVVRPWLIIPARSWSFAIGS